MNETHKKRFTSADWYEIVQKKEVVIVGAGGIGSWIPISLVRSGFHISILDFDFIEAHNIGGQFFKINQVGGSKIDAVVGNVNEFCNETIYSHYHKIDPTVKAETYKTLLDNRNLILALDNIPTREFLANAWYKFNRDNNDVLLIDPRLEAEFYQIFTIKAKGDSQDFEKYSKVALFKDELPDGACTLRQTSHIAQMLGGHICTTLINFYSNLANKQDIRNIHDFVQYDASLNTFKIKNYAEFD